MMNRRHFTIALLAALNGNQLLQQTIDKRQQLSTLDEIILLFNDLSSIEDKNLVLREIYGHKAMLIPVTFKSTYQVEEGVHVPAGAYNIYMDRKEIAVYHKKEDKTESAFELKNQNIHMSSHSLPLEIPSGYSILIVRKGSNPKTIEKLVDALSVYATKNPLLGIEKGEIGVISRGLKNLRY